MNKVFTRKQELKAHMIRYLNKQEENLLTLKQDLKNLADPNIAEHSQRFFKTAKGEYGYGDKFLGIRVPRLRTLAKKYQHLSQAELANSISSRYHEERLVGLIILVNQYKASKCKDEKKKIYSFYIKNFKYINNWDLVDLSCHKIIGPQLWDEDNSILDKWAKSKNLWTRRISIISTYYFIQRHHLDDTFRLAQTLIHDKEDLIHKAVGWMLREAGKRDLKRLEQFLKSRYTDMPRTMLRYAIEKFPEAKRQKYLKGNI